MKKSLKILLAALAVYLLLLLLLLAAESRADGASIRSFGDALWYSLITMTTVGYGDLAPVTAAGRVLGLVFALFSLGVLTAMIGLGLRLVSGRAIPRLRLRRARKKPWYVFFDGGQASASLAKDLSGREDAIVVFPVGEKTRHGLKSLIRADLGAEELLRLRGQTDGLTLFYLGPDPWKNCADALADAASDVRQVCLSAPTEIPDTPGFSFFDPAEAVARRYWQEQPLRRAERVVVLIGCAQTGSAVLERALLNNVFEPDRCVEYHVFEDEAGFETLHPRLLDAFKSDPAGDNLSFHREDWRADPELLKSADRILLCRESDRDNLKAYQELKTWFPLQGAIHLRLTEALPGLCSFGNAERTFTAEAVLREELDRRAITIHKIYSESAPEPTPWSRLSPFLQQANVAAADHLPVKARLILGDDSTGELTQADYREAYQRFLALLEQKRDFFQEIEHRRWMRFYLMYNWSFGPDKDSSIRQHPLLVPYGSLSDADKAKDLFPWELLGRIGQD